MLVGKFRCDSGFIFDIHNSERVEIENDHSEYYVTPRGLAQIEKWIIDNFILTKVGSLEEIKFFIEQDWLKKY